MYENCAETVKLSAKEESCDNLDVDVVKTESPESQPQTEQPDHNSVNNNTEVTTDVTTVKTETESVPECCDVGCKRPGEDMEEVSFRFIVK